MPRIKSAARIVLGREIAHTFALSTAFKRVRGVSPQYSYVRFESGTVLHVPSASVALPTDSAGVFQPSIAGLTSNRSLTLQDLDFEWQAIFGDLQWGKRVGPDTTIGVNLNAAHSEMEFGLGGNPATRSDSDTFGARLGGLHPVAKRWAFGLVLDYAQVRGDIEEILPAPDQRVETIEQFVAWPGVSCKHARWTFFADYQYGRFDNGQEVLQVHRGYLGINNEITDAFSLRAGANVDDRGNVAWTAGFGVYPARNLGIEFGYQYDMFPEVHEEFGRSHLFNISLTFTF